MDALNLLLAVWLGVSPHTDPTTNALGHPSWANRERAENTLLKERKLSLALRAACVHPDPELRLRANRIFNKILWQDVKVVWVQTDFLALFFEDSDYYQNQLPQAQSVFEYTLDFLPFPYWKLYRGDRLIWEGYYSPECKDLARRLLEQNTD
jgi:hypothetical protein